MVASISEALSKLGGEGQDMVEGVISMGKDTVSDVKDVITPGNNQDVVGGGKRRRKKSSKKSKKAKKSKRRRRSKRR